MLAFVLVLVLMVVFHIGRSLQIIGLDAAAVTQRLEDQQRVARLLVERQGDFPSIHLATDGSVQNIRLGEEVVFASGRADLTRAGRELLGALARTILDNDITSLREIQVSGHTDDVPITTPEFPSNWELSSVRATRIVEFLIASGIDPTTVVLSGTGYGPFVPLRPNTSEAGRAANRRIELRLIYTDEVRGSG